MRNFIREFGSFYPPGWIAVATLLVLIFGATPGLSGQCRQGSWCVQTKTDPITETTTSNTVLNVPTESNARRGEAEVTAACGSGPANHVLSFTIDYHSPSDKNPRFETSTLDSSVMPSMQDAIASGLQNEISMLANPDAVYAKVLDEGEAHSIVKFRARIDNKPVTAWSADKYTNELNLNFFDGWRRVDVLQEPYGKSELPPAGPLYEGIHARRILVELPLVNGDRPIVDLRLDDPVFRKFIAGCRFPHVAAPDAAPGPPGERRGQNVSAGVASAMRMRGINISAGIANSMRIGGVMPVYPPSARAAGVSGTVVLQALIGPDGLVHKLTPISSPSPSLTSAATAAVRMWRYRPYLLNGQPVAVTTYIDVSFQ